MQKSYRFIVTILILGSYLLSACAGVVPQGDNSGGGSDSNSNEVLDVNDNASNVNQNSNDGEDNENGNGNDSQGNENGNNSDDSSSDDLEFHGVIEVITDLTVTIDGVEYSLTDLTEFKDIVAVGDQVKIHFIVNADGTFTILEIELSHEDDNGNSNSNYKGDDHSNSNSNDDDHNNSNGNSNDNDDYHDNSNKNSNDDD